MQSRSRPFRLAARGDESPTLLARPAEAGKHPRWRAPKLRVFGRTEYRALSLAGSKVAMRTLTAAFSGNARHRDATERALAAARRQPPLPCERAVPRGGRSHACFRLVTTPVCARARVSRQMGGEGRRERGNGDTFPTYVSAMRTRTIRSRRSSIGAASCAPYAFATVESSRMRRSARSSDVR